MLQTQSRFVLFGPQGSGKGTQAKRLAQALGVPHISTGEIFRDHIARSTPLGERVQALIAQGGLVPDELTNEVVAERLIQPDAENGFVLDGYPRNMDQAEFLQGRLAGITAILLELSDDEAVRRIAGRLTCVRCGAVYHSVHAPPRRPNQCDHCQGELKERDDDTEIAVRERLATYHRETEPLVAYYGSQGQLISVDGTPSIDDVARSVRRALELP